MTPEKTLLPLDAVIAVQEYRAYHLARLRYQARSCKKANVLQQKKKNVERLVNASINIASVPRPVWRDFFIPRNQLCQLTHLNHLNNFSNCFFSSSRFRVKEHLSFCG